MRTYEYMDITAVLRYQSPNTTNFGLILQLRLREVYFLQNLEVGTVFHMLGYVIVSMDSADKNR